ncbi:hypothetical protein I3760_02G116100 [Carya illinoinensis]|nr:hypothetical protein I3760_02G116100 [Carya illinoinensis]
MFLYCSAMGIEVTDICLDKEPDCVIVYANGVSHDSDHEPDPNHHGGQESYEPINEGPEIQSTEESTEAKEYDVKECTTENSVEVSEFCHNEKYKEEQNVVNSHVKAGLHKESVKSETQKKKDNNKSQISVKQASRSVAANARTKHTVPQPFSLATEKRASYGLSSGGAQPDFGTRLNKLSNANTVRHPNIIKLNQQISDWYRGSHCNLITRSILMKKILVLLLPPLQDLQGQLSPSQLLHQLQHLDAWSVLRSGRR